MIGDRTNSKSTAFVFSVVIVTIFFILPFLKEIITTNFITPGDTIKSGFIEAILRSLFFGVTATFFCVIFGFIGAFLLKKITVDTKIGKLVSLLLLPAMIGNTSIAFIGKLLLGQTAFVGFFIDNGNWSVFSLLVIIQCWQFGFLFLYLFWLNFQSIPKKLIEYSYSLKLSSIKRIKDIYLPYSRNLLILLFLIGFVFNFYEDAKNQFIFKASQGTNTELITHWLYRTYQSYLLGNPNLAMSKTFMQSLYIFIIAVLSFGLIAFLTNIFISSVSKTKLWSRINPRLSYPINVFVLCAYLVIVIFPITISIFRLHFSDLTSLTLLVKPLLLTLIAAFSSASFAIIFGITARMAWKKVLADFNRKSNLFFIVIYLLQLIPSLVILLCGFKWLSFTGYNSEIGIWLIWIIGHTLLSFALLGSFILATHFGVKTTELEYLESYKIPFANIIKTSFLSRFKLQYILTILFSFGFIWNEAVLNHVLSDTIPSFVANLEMLINGRATDYSQASGYFLVSIVISLIIVFIWTIILNQATKRHIENK